MSASCSSLPLVCFSLLECTRHPPKGSAVARREGKHWKETKNKEKNFRLEPVRQKFIWIYTGAFGRKCNSANDFVACKSVTSCSDVAMGMKSKHDMIYTSCSKMMNYLSWTHRYINICINIIIILLFGPT